MPRPKTTTPQGLSVRKLAEQDGIERVPRWDPNTGARRLVNAVTGEDCPYPLKGVVFEGEAPRSLRVSTTLVLGEPWIELVNPRPVFKPSGPPGSPWSAPAHTFTHCDELVLHMLDRDYRYRVVRQPDKYDDETGLPSDSAGDPTTRVDWFYDAELIGEG